MAGHASKGLECPHCGGKALCTKAGRANNGTIMVRLRKCTECGRSEQTVETYLPHGLTSIEKLDEEIKFRQMMRDRENNGYRGTNRGHPKTVDRLKIAISVIPGKKLRRTPLTQEGWKHPDETPDR